jgi:RecQ family ATP-dependent DNA helicase
MVCIDEAHAVSTWGLDFRSGYTELKIIKSWLPDVPILTLTATASTKVREDIYKILRLSNPELIIGDFDRPNLHIRVLPRTDRIIDDIEALLNKYKNEYVIIYCKTRDDTDLLSDQICDFGIKCDSYHAGMNDKNRKKVQQDFINGTVKCICATIAFGMGINIPNVRLIIHYNCPKNVESYYQEIGRAGRDNKPSECVLFYSARDFIISRFLIKDMKNLTQKKYQEDQIRQMEKYIYSNCCRRKIILLNFGQSLESCSNCDNCLASKTIKKENLIMIDYTCPIYLILNVLTKTNGKFGIVMNINVLLGKQNKIKDWMNEWEEFGSGISFGNENWWKELVRYLINEDYLIETQAQGMFYSTINLTNKARDYWRDLLLNYPNYLSLVKDYNKLSENYLKIQIELPKLKSIETTTKIKKNKSNNLDKIKVEKVSKKNITPAKSISNTLGVSSITTKISTILNSDSDSE